MKLLAVSEHYFPRVGGTVNYLHETLSALVDEGMDVELLVPGPAPEIWIPDGGEKPKYTVRWLESGYPLDKEPNRADRYRFGQAVNEYIGPLLSTSEKPNIVHVMFGLFVMETLNTQTLRNAKIPTVATVHNVPPQECRIVTPTAPVNERIREHVRLFLVGLKNNWRLRRHRYDKLIVPSSAVRSLLSQRLRSQDIEVLVHGPTSALAKQMAPPINRRPPERQFVRILTVGGFAPHKRQHLIPLIAENLRADGVAFKWDVIGPAGRVPAYFDQVSSAIQSADLQDQVRVNSSVSFAELARFYDAANLYVQPSTEEGFCITALDAAAAGLPVIASPAGALPEIVRASHGLLAKSAVNPLSDAIKEFIRSDLWSDPKQVALEVESGFSWRESARSLKSSYDKLSEHTL